MIICKQRFNIFIRITEFEVLKTVKNFKNKKSSDPHGLSMEILMQVIPNIVKPLTYTCNKSFIENCLPDSTKSLGLFQFSKMLRKVH